MALHVSMGRASRTVRTLGSLAPCRAHSPPCRTHSPPCRAYSPPCRAHSPPGRRGLLVLCCAPAQGEPPPCPPAPPSGPLTCRDAVYENCESSSQTCAAHIPQPSGFSCEQDSVARRLQVARDVRRAHFHWELACRAAAGRAPAPCAAPYALTGLRECARATDGCTYAVLAPPTQAAPARCGPGRAPPPPRCVELAADGACRIRGNEHLDPCAHRPRVMIEIDRSVTQYGCSKSPPVCCQSNRCIHTSAALFKAEKCVPPVSGGIEGMVRSKEQLKEAGLGRVVTDAADVASARTSLGGRLELHVPPGTERVAVHVSLLAADSASDSYPPASEPTASLSCANLNASVRNPCLPFNKSPKKWTGSGELGAQSAGARCSGLCSPCGPPVPRRCKPGPAPNESNNETKRFASTAAFLANTVI